MLLMLQVFNISSIGTDQIEESITHVIAFTSYVRIIHLYKTYNNNVMIGIAYSYLV